MAFQMKNVPEWGGSARWSRSGRKPKGISGMFRYMKDALTPGGLPGLSTVEQGGTISQRWTGMTPRDNPAFDSSLAGGRRNPLGPPGGRPRRPGGRPRGRPRGTGGVRSVLSG